MRTRFEGPDGSKLLREALLRQEIVQQNERLAEDIATKGELVSITPNTDIVVQGNADNEVYFLISGECGVFVNDRFIGDRKEGTCIGEMAAIDFAAPRSATVRAKTEVIAIKITEPNFRAALDASPQAYKHLAQMLGKRLRQRSAFHQPPNPIPVLFVGCSVEALPIANEIQVGLKHDKIDVVIWKDGVFGPSGTPVESLCHMAHKADFAAFVISPDDTVLSREENQLAPRDNVVFELGLFMGVLDQKRTYLIQQGKVDVKIPTDLLGITPITYVIKEKGNFKSAIGPVCSELRANISRLGVR